ncbi:FMN-binding protein [Alkalibacter sp. M17DMB]|nr:FMN-binding protein [Alkalibacter mobilis]
MEVTFTETEIKDIKILNHSESAGISDPAFERIPNEIIETQSLNVDVVSGCTMTSNALLSGVEEAASLAGADIEALKAREGKVTGSTEKIEKTADVVIVGGGGAGLIAATSALENGATVILVEKPAALGGNTILAGENAANNK